MKYFIIIVTYNGINWIERCLQSCENQEVIVVDNASTDSTVKYIESNFPKVEILKQSKNLGFGSANNIGISRALKLGAEYVFLLNQDAYLVDDVLEKLVSFQSQNPLYGILSPIHITNDKLNLDKKFLRYMLKSKDFIFFSDFVLGNTIKPVYDIPFVNAAGWLISKECILSVGGFDPLFFHYGEDNNYCQRVLFHSFKIGVIPNAYIIHDRANRIIKPVKEFSKEYYKNKETYFKKQFADILNNRSISKEERNLKRTILKSVVKFRIRRAKNVKRELQMLKQLKPLITKSIETNKLKGNHYL